MAASFIGPPEIPEVRKRRQTRRAMARYREKNYDALLAQQRLDYKTKPSPRLKGMTKAEYMIQWRKNNKDKLQGYQKTRKAIRRVNRKANKLLTTAKAEIAGVISKVRKTFKKEERTNNNPFYKVEVSDRVQKQIILDAYRNKPVWKPKQKVG